MLLSNKKKIVLLSIAHLINDWYMNFIQVLMPFFVMYGIGLSKGAFLIAAFTITSSLMQPLFGYLVDHKNQQWMIYFGTAWMAILVSLLGVFNNYPLLVIIATLSGVGTAAFHPQASAIVSALSNNRKNFFQACFIAAGNLGGALTPVIVIPFVEAYSLKLMPVFIFPGVGIAILLWLFSAPKKKIKEQLVLPSLPPIPRSSLVELSKLVVVVSIRSLVNYGLIAFLPLYFQSMNVSLQASSHLLFIMLFFGAVGGILGGYLADIFGRKLILVGSLFISSPLFYFFLNSDGFTSKVLLAFAGTALLASYSITVVIAQEIINTRTSLASGIMVGFSNGAGGLGVGILGLIAEHMGIAYTINLLIWIPIMISLFSLIINDKQESTLRFSNS